MDNEWILNIVTNREGLNQKSSVGPVSYWIRSCNPKNIKEWEEYYFEKLAGMLKQKGLNYSPSEYLEVLGQTLHTKIKEDINFNKENVKIIEADCIKYIRKLVINRTYDGFKTEKEIIYDQLQRILKMPIKPTSDKWDRQYNVDFFIEINTRCIGLQIKPITFKNAPGAKKWEEMLRKTHRQFQLDYGSKVFTIFTQNLHNERVIVNRDIIKDIQREIARLKEFDLNL